MKKHKEPVWLMIVRIALACVFLFSGLSKAIDPVGFGIKMDEYFFSFGMGFLHPFSLLLAMLAITAEFTLGFMLLFKIKARLAALGYLLFMTFFLFLTAWLAGAEYLVVHHGYNLQVVTDCGCFGEVIKMSNLETFLKNLALMIVTLIVFGYRKAIPEARFTLLGQWVFIFLGACIAVGVQIYCLQNLPVLDFSKWKKGTNTVDFYIDKPAVKDMLFLYQNNEGEEKLLSIEDMDSITSIYPNFYNEFTYIDRVDSVVTEAVKAKKEGFSMLDDQGRDFASTFLNINKESVYILFMHDLDEVSDDAMKSNSLQALVSYCENNKIDFVGITNSPPDVIKTFIEDYHIKFPIYYNPIDPVKGPFIVRDAIRSNPGLIVLKNGIVAEKKAWRNF